MKVGDILDWLDQGPAILLKRCEIPAPCPEEHLGEYMEDPESWPSEIGWTVQLVGSGEILDVHEETLNSGFSLKVEAILDCK